MMKVKLMLEDGTILQGHSQIPTVAVQGEIVFNTSMTGYEEILTDPSYAGQIVVMTYPLIGNYGVEEKVKQSKDIQVSGLIVKEASESIKEYLQQEGIPLVEGVDTRYLTKQIRNHGSMGCKISTDFNDDSPIIYNLTDQCSYKTRKYNGSKIIKSQQNTSLNIGVLDLGCKQSIIDQLLHLGCNVHIFPYGVEAKEVMEQNLDAILISNGPGNPQEATLAIDLCKSLLGVIPLWGICLGHQILALSLGASTYKLKFGHRGGNHPVLDVKKERVVITAQNHGYGVIKDSLPKGCEVTFTHVNDQSVEGLCHKKNNVHTVQFHPEDAPGPEDASYIMKNWLKELGILKTTLCGEEATYA